MEKTIETPFDSGSFPKSVLLQDSHDLADSYCGKCQRPAEEWTRILGFHPAGSRPCAMFQAELFCSDCMPESYSVEGWLVRTLDDSRI